LIAVGALCTALGACVTTEDVNSKITQVQDFTRIGCSFVPTVTTVAKILAAGNPIVDTASSVADAICAAVTTVPLADGPGDSRPRVNGVVVEGKFIR
jgi:hypothetical protein